MVFVIDDDFFTRQSISDFLEDDGCTVETFESCELFLQARQERPGSCIVLDLHFPGMGGLKLLEQIRDMTDAPPVIVVSGASEISDAVQSLKGGALDFLEKPVAQEKLLGSVRAALVQSQQSGRTRASRNLATGRLGDLTLRQREIMDMVLAGHPSKNIAADLGISQRTVEAHRASIMERTGAESLPALARLVMCTVCPLTR